ncbi:hypothetical protein C0J52_23635 [Blattella germanica]|nr:hypothetical protein C0J52_23635 [Blattella germanica]
MVNGYSIVTYQRPVKAQDELDRTIYTNGTQPIIWAIGPLNSRNEVSYHSITNKGDVFLDFGRPPKWNCPIPETDSSASASGTPSKPASEQQPPASEEVTTVATPRRRVQATPKPVSKKDAWYIPPIQCDEPEDVSQHEHLPAIYEQCFELLDDSFTGHVGWGISWYINGLLIPVINVVRGKTYTFYTEGGDNPDIPAKYHPFYITDDPIGGYEHKTPEERAVTISYFLQCFSHRYLGWKINVLDSCDETAAGSEQIKIRVPAVEEDDLDEGEDDVEGELQGRPSIRVATRVKPNGVFINTKDEFSKQNEHKYIPLNEFPQLPSNTQQNFQQEFPFSYEPVTTESTIAQDEGTISEAFVPPPSLQKEPIPSPQFENNESSNSGMTPTNIIFLNLLFNFLYCDYFLQCFSHRYLGWKINVLDSCDETAAGSEQIKIRVPAVEEDDLDEGEDDVEGELQGRPSIRVATRVKPNGVFINTKDEFSKQNEHKYIPLNEFPQLPSNTQQNFQQEFPFSYEPVTTESTIAQDEGTISEAFVPPPSLQKEPIPSPQFENNESSNSGQGVNASYQNPGVQLQNPTYYTYQMVKDVNSSGTQVDPNFAQQTGISIQLPSQQLVPTIINAQALPLGSIAPNQQLNPIALPNTQLLNPSQITVGSTQPLVNVQAQVNSVQAQIDASRNPTVTEPEVEAAASSAVNVTENNPEPAEPKSKIPVPNKAMGLIPGKMSHHTTLIPQAYSRIPIHPAMIFQRPLQPYTLAPHFRRPVPHRGFSRPPPPTIFRPQFAGAASTQHNYIIKKPFYRPPPQRPMTMPPQYHRPVGKPRIPMQHTATSIKIYHITLPPQNQPLKLRKVGTSTTTTSTTTPLPPPTQTQVDQSGLIKPSPSILPSDVIVLNARDTLTIPVAVNTGFNPHSVVVEGGFKPIITSKNAVAAASAQDRSAVVSDKEEEVQSVQEEKDSDKQENEEIIDKSEEAMIAELASEVVAAINEEERKENPFQGQQPESFEPMFIPSPPDRRNGTDAKKPILPEGLMPPVPHLHHRNSPQPNRKNGHPYMMIRPRPGLVRRPLYPNNIVPPFRIRGSPTFRYQQSEEILEDETPMAAERMDSYYLPPGDSAIPPGVVVTYDGKSVADTGLSSPVGVKNIRAPIGTADFIRGTPQVVPYRGEIPPPVPENIRPESIPQLNKKNQQLAQSLPEQFKQQNDAFPDPPSIQSTQLKLVQNDELISEGSENKEVTVNKDKSKKQTEKKSATSKEEGEIMTTVDDRWPFSTNMEQTGDELSTVPSVEMEGITNEQNAESLTKKPTERREKRSAHHEPGHEGHDHTDDTNHQHSDHDHTDHQHMDHDHHDHSQGEKRSSASYVVFSSTFLLFCIVISMYL